MLLEHTSVRVHKHAISTSKAVMKNALEEISSVVTNASTRTMALTRRENAQGNACPAAFLAMEFV